MVLTSSCRSQYIYVSDAGQILQGPSESFGLVIMLLLIDFHDDVLMTFHQCGRQGIHISYHEFGKPVPSEYCLAVAEKFPEGPVTADDEVCRADEIARELAFREGSVADYDYIPMQGVR